jgi:hypothetical protein
LAGSAILGWLSLALVAGSEPLPAPAADQSHDPSPAEPAAAEAPPSAELLMYFAEFEDVEGDFVDPLALETDAAKALTGKPGVPPTNTERVDEQAPRAR